MSEQSSPIPAQVLEKAARAVEHGHVNRGWVSTFRQFAQAALEAAYFDLHNQALEQAAAALESDDGSYGAREMAKWLRSRKVSAE